MNIHTFFFNIQFEKHYLRAYQATSHNYSRVFKNIHLFHLIVNSGAYQGGRGYVFDSISCMVIKTAGYAISQKQNFKKIRI